MHILHVAYKNYFNKTVYLPVFDTKHDSRSSNQTFLLNLTTHWNFFRSKNVYNKHCTQEVKVYRIILIVLY